MVRGSWGRKERVNLIEEFYMTGLDMLDVMDGFDDDICVAGKSEEADNLAVTVKEIDVSVVASSLPPPLSSAALRQLDSFSQRCLND
ncbi:hypothetical protein An08g03500 [Aspergillus niger]|uniref:Uncharacterized protein n=2 Tax=Aspergillus niger TaxID=5061 RepID=A2QQS1_ASPNC|nr:hypothetical protein An08g03500 [Aspergillus niger]CAK45387.1 hypothetical protein An08g03500 [Aspergillus niger]